MVMTATVGSTASMRWTNCGVPFPSIPRSTTMTSAIRSYRRKSPFFVGGGSTGDAHGAKCRCRRFGSVAVIDEKDHRAADRPGQDGNDVFDVEWFREHRESTFQNRLVNQALYCKPGHQDDRHVRMLASDRSKKVDAVHSRHADVREDEVECLPTEKLERTRCVFGADDFETLELEVGDQCQEKGIFVVDDEDTHSFAPDGSSLRGVLDLAREARS